MYCIKRILTGAFLMGAMAISPFFIPQTEASNYRGHNRISGFGFGIGGGYYGRPRYYRGYRGLGYYPYRYGYYRSPRYYRYSYPRYRGYYNPYFNGYYHGRPRGGVYFNWGR